MNLSNKLFFNKINQIFLDLIIFGFSFFAAYFIRFEGLPSGMHLKQFWILIPYIIIARFLVFQLFSVYSIVWRYISIADSITIFKATGVVSVLLYIARAFLPNEFNVLRIPYGVITIEFLLVLLGTMGIRALRRLLIETRARAGYNNGDNEGRAKSRKVLLIGAGDSGNMVAKELKRRPDLGMRIIGFIDDDPKKFNTVIQGFKVLGNTSQLSEIAARYSIDEAVITIANASSKDIRQIVDLCEAAKIKAKIIPGLYEILGGKIKISKIREVNIDDLLGRSVVEFENNVPEILKKYRNKKILITGAGGSIGSELCRQLSLLWPKELILLDKDENSIFEIDAELDREYENVKLVSVIADVRNWNRMRQIFQKFRPDVVFHAAAHKHVPLMEHNVTEAIRNNVLGTKHVAELADEFGVESLIYISTDKAVNPVSIMGATKKVGEILIQEIAKKGRTHYSCVRFGNVLGSRGSVVPFFQRQISWGGPVTVTHPDVIRYFMSISEAVQLIIKAGSIGEKGEIFVLDMGEPVKILDLAKDLIKLSGLREEDIEIKYVGLRPGEKLFEEMLVDEERMQATNFQKIFIAPPVEVDGGKFHKSLERLIEEAGRCNGADVVRCLFDMGIGYSSERQ